MLKTVHIDDNKLKYLSHCVCDLRMLVSSMSTNKDTVSVKIICTRLEDILNDPDFVKIRL